jgi:hypothetical protein
MRILEDGSVLSSAVPVATKKNSSHRNLFGIYRGVIIRAVYPDDPNNTTKERMEYVVKVRGQTYPNAINVREAGGIYNYRERIRKGIEKSSSGVVSKGTFDELLDGEHVYVAFLEGHGNSPLIIGASEHKQHPKYKKPTSADGLFDVYEFNGVEVKIDKDGNYTITNLGQKDKDGKIINPDAVGTFFKIGSAGDIELNNGASKITITPDGIVVQDEFGNKIELKDGELNISAVAKVSVTAPDTAEFKGTAGTNLGDASSPTKVDGQTVALAGGGLPVARINDICIGTGNLGAPVISRIIAGSTKVSSS